MCERTSEFLQLVNVAKSSGKIDIVKNVKNNNAVPKTKTAFNEAAGEIARGVHRTSALLSKLTKLVRRQGLFDDPTDEINNLIYKIKQDLDDMNSKCDSAQQYIDSRKGSYGESNQSSTHSVKVVSHLKSDLMETTKDFKTVLELRSSKMKDQQVRKVELIGKGMLSPLRGIENAAKQAQNKSKTDSHSKNSNGIADSSQNSSLVRRSPAMNKLPSPYMHPYNLHSSNAEQANRFSTPNALEMQQQQELLLDPVAENQYYDAREKAVSEVEKTIGELGQLFNRLALMISEQQELVERVDEDVENALENTDKAQNILLKTYENVSSNKNLYFKLFVILAVFVLFFVIFLL